MNESQITTIPFPVEFGSPDWLHDRELLAAVVYIYTHAARATTTRCGTTIQRGQLATTVNELTVALNTTFNKARKRLMWLHDSGIIDMQTTNKYTLITVKSLV